MLKNVYCIFSCFLFALSSITSAQNVADPVLISITGKGIKREISKSEFVRIYSKNNTQAVESKKPVDDYLDLFINFKLKVTEAEALGYDTMRTFVNEFSGYRSQLAKPYLLDTNIRNTIIKSQYDRMNKEVRVKHIMIRLDNAQSSPADTLAAYNKAMRFYNEIQKGLSFEKLAKDSSDDTYSATNGGDLGYFSAFKYPYEFELVVHNMKLNQVSKPIHTSFGYHIAKVTDIRPAQGRVRVAHIIKVTPQGMSEREQDSIKEIVDNLYTQLQKKADFATIAKANSDDRRTAETGGELPWFNTGRMIPEFETAAFALQKDGAISAPFKTMYGWHIIKRLERESAPSFTQAKTDLYSKAEKGELADIIKKAYIQKLKKEYSYTEQLLNLKELFTLSPELIDTAKNIKQIGSFPKVIFTIGQQKYTQEDFLNFIINKPNVQLTESTLEYALYKIFEQYRDEQIIAYEDARLESKYIAFRDLLKEYHDGILLFNIMDEHIWSKAVKDSAGLAEFHKDNESKYSWGERLSVNIVYGNSDSVIEKTFTEYTKNKEVGIEALLVDINKNLKGKDTVWIENVKISKGDNKVIDSTGWEPGVVPVHKKDLKFYFAIKLNKVIPELKTLNEARGLVISDYQDYLEKQWLIDLRKKYSFTVNITILSDIK